MTAWDIATIAYSRTEDISAKHATLNGLFIDSGGTHMYTVDWGTEINQYTLGTAWNITTSSWDRTISTAAKQTGLANIFFNPTGSKMYTIGITTATVDEYNLGTPWDLSTAVYSQEKDVSAKAASPRGLYISDNGLKMYTMDNTDDDCDEWTLNPAWDITSATWIQNLDVTAREDNCRDVFLKPDGSKLYVVGITGAGLDQYALGTNWDLSTASWEKYESVGAQGNGPRTIMFKPDGSRLYVAESQHNSIDEYNLPAAGPDFSKVQVNVGDVWKDATNVQVNVGDVWKTATKMEINIGDAWKTVFST